MAASTAKVSSKGVATVKISCHGSGRCSGRLTLRLTRKLKVKVHKRTVVRKSTTTIGSAKFGVNAGHSVKVSVTLVHKGATAVTAAAAHRLKVTLVLAPAGAKAHNSMLTLIGPAPRHHSAAKTKKR